MNEDTKEDTDPEHRELVGASIVASRLLTGLNIKHCLIGQLALVGHGHIGGDDPFQELSVEFLVGPGAFGLQEEPEGSVLISTVVGLPSLVGEVSVRLIPLDGAAQDEAFSEDLVMPTVKDHVPIGSVAAILTILALENNEYLIEEAIRGDAPAAEVARAVTVLRKACAVGVSPRAARKLEKLLDSYRPRRS